jgi:hypothetical protein
VTEKRTAPATAEELAALAADQAMTDLLRKLSTEPVPDAVVRAFRESLANDRLLLVALSDSAAEHQANGGCTAGELCPGYGVLGFLVTISRQGAAGTAHLLRLLIAAVSLLADHRRERGNG